MAVMNNDNNINKLLRYNVAPSVHTATCKHVKNKSAAAQTQAVVAQCGTFFKNHASWK
jgi:hypothetical protein